MDTPILSSTFFLTLLLGVGLGFFIRASIKERTEQLQFATEQSQESILDRLQQHFQQRGYRVVPAEATGDRITFAGFVRPSWFLAIFLTLLAAIGALCLALVLSLLLPDWSTSYFCLVLLAPLAGVFYWRKAGRLEQVSLQIEPIVQGEVTQPQIRVTLAGHRDELAVLRQALQLPMSH